ncbi:class I SAM-dependent methyltransferase [Lysinibacillus sp. CD3-6]|uniref:class I SAM-dependent methyltransferase n=1 Tax=Lysinibacillus sp. CD3-6 TaxID=2892541 RepID=UPI00116AB090|nr:class I SAM-dependent methyltransferase [Lysinibacillus sp. CD3-6]UED78503.1 class I SAM-dependent methyltransferase [Lysinibacillus sp. CD3-6]
MTILQRLIEQAKHPNGLIGSIMLRIMNVAHRGMTSWLIESGAIKNGDIVLDIGCGGGKTIQALSRINHHGKIYGIDFSEQAIRNATKVNKKDVASGKVIVKQASVSNIPYPDAYFDKIIACQTHYFWQDFAKDVKEVFRVLKKDGQFIIISELYKINYHREDYKTNKEIRQLFDHVGFQFVNIQEHKRNGWLYIMGTK